MPFLPYFYQIPQRNFFSLNSQFTLSTINQQQMDSLSTERKIPSSQLQKSVNFNKQCPIQESKEQAYLQTKKQTAAIESQPYLHSDEKQVRDTKENTLNSDLGNSNAKKYNRLVLIIKNEKRKIINEEEYKPFQKKKVSYNFPKKNQDRNIIPNWVNQIFSYIQKSSKSKLVVSRIFLKYPAANQNYNINKFYVYQSLLKQKTSNYINESSLSLVTEVYEPMCDVYSEQQQRYYNKICRILIHHFLQQDSIFNILTSRRMHRENKKDHLEMRRVLKDKVVKILRR